VPDERGLADAGGARDGRDHRPRGAVGQPVERGQLRGAADQLRHPGHLVRHGSSQLVVHRADGGARLDAAVLDEDRAQPVVGGECLVAPARAGERLHQLAPRDLPQRVRVDVAGQLVDQLGVPAEREVRLDPGLPRTVAQLDEPAPGTGDQWGRRQVGEHRPAPQRERPPEHLRGVLGRPRAQCRPALVRAGGEHHGVDVAVGDDEPVAGVDGQQRARAGLAECAADPQHVAVDLGERGARRPVAPQLEEQLVDGEYVAAADQQRGEQRPRLGGGDPAPRVAVVRGDVAEQPVPHRITSVPPPLLTLRAPVRLPGVIRSFP
jgi:hypothetical protein